MPSSTSLATQPAPDASSDAERLLKFPVPLQLPAVEDVSLLDRALGALQHLYQLNIELAQSLERSQQSVESAEQQSKKWEQFANAAMARVKTAETNGAALKYRLDAAEADNKSLREQIAASKREATSASKALAAYKDEVSATFRKYDQVQDIINTVHTGGYQHVSGAHFRTVRANAVKTGSA